MYVSFVFRISNAHISNFFFFQLFPLTRNISLRAIKARNFFDLEKGTTYPTYQYFFSTSGSFFFNISQHLIGQSFMIVS